MLATVAVVATAGGCGDAGKLSPAAERGRQTYLAQCTACHNVDPSQAGSVGPAVKGASREVIESKVLRGTYPPGYAPKRPTSIMQPIPAVAPDVPALAEYLR